MLNVERCKFRSRFSRSHALTVSRSHTLTLSRSHALTLSRSQLLTFSRSHPYEPQSNLFHPLPNRLDRRSLATEAHPEVPSNRHLPRQRLPFGDPRQRPRGSLRRLHLFP